jgi:glycosyltransferase involved in cell wall biosynthesis
VRQRLRILGIGDANSRHLIRWAHRLVDRGHDVHLVSNRVSPRPGELDGITTHLFRDLDPLMRVRGLRRFRITGLLEDIARQLEPDIVHSHYLLPYGYWVARAGLQPLVVSPWGKDAIVDARQGGRPEQWARAAIEPGRLFVVNSAALEQAAVELGADPGRIRRILWHANIDGFAPEQADPSLRRRLGWPDDALVVLSLRNFRPYTNLDILLRAFAEAVRQEPRLRLFSSAGGGWTRDEIERLIDELAVRHLVAIEAVPAPRLPSVIAAADVAVTLADVDSSPASLLESMASGLPFVAGLAPSIDEWLVQGEGAEMVARRDVAAVTEAILRLARDPERRRAYGQRNLRLVHERFGDPGAQLERVYEEVLAA